jgi:glyoxylase-like metal-dependent hydrolase (beta-lactamase superfamily II)
MLRINDGIARMSRYSSGVALLLAAWLAAGALAACSHEAQKPPTGTSVAARAIQRRALSESADVKPFTIGNLSAAALRDGALEFPNDNEVFGVGRTPDEVAAVLSAAGAPTDKLHLSIQPLLVRTTNRVMLFDTGAGTNMGPSAGRLPASMAAAGVDPRSVTDICISHVHGDHVGGLVDAQGALVFVNATIHLSAPEWAFLKGMNAEAAKNAAIARHDTLVRAITPKVVTFAPGAPIIRDLVEAVEIKGHTPGHSGYPITSGESSLLYAGDALHHYVVSTQRPEWPNSFDWDTAGAARSRTELLARSAASRQRLYFVHFPFPGIGRIEMRGNRYVWVPE